jgi:hypothetical protein
LPIVNLQTTIQTINEKKKMATSSKILDGMNRFIVLACAGSTIYLLGSTASQANVILQRNAQRKRDAALSQTTTTILPPNNESTNNKSS